MATRRWPFSYIRRFEDMQAAVNKAYIKNIIVQMTPGQEAQFTYSAENIEVLVKYLSNERLAAYFTMAKRSPEGAIRLYERNTELSEALYGVVQGFEVTLRNAVHNVLTAVHGATWYETFSFLDSEQNAVVEAKAQIEQRLEKITSGRVVAELTFGFWVRLFSASYDKTLWGPSLRKIMPMKLPRRAVYERLKDIKTLGNRIAHHNRIIGQRKTVAVLYEETMDAIGWLSPTIHRWIETTNCVEVRLTKKFPPVKKQATIVAIAAERNPPCSGAPKDPG